MRWRHLSLNKDLNSFNSYGQKTLAAARQWLEPWGIYTLLWVISYKVLLFWLVILWNSTSLSWAAPGLRIYGQGGSNFLYRSRSQFTPGYMDLMLAVNLPFLTQSRRLEKICWPSVFSLPGSAIAYRDLDQDTKALESVERSASYIW